MSNDKSRLISRKNADVSLWLSENVGTEGQKTTRYQYTVEECHDLYTFRLGTNWGRTGTTYRQMSRLGGTHPAFSALVLSFVIVKAIWTELSSSPPATDTIVLYRRRTTSEWAHTSDRQCCVRPHDEVNQERGHLKAEGDQGAWNLYEELVVRTISTTW